MEFSYGTPPHSAHGCETLALRTDLWMKTHLRVQSAHSPWGWASLTHGRRGVWPRAGCAPARAARRWWEHHGVPLGCAIPGTLPSACSSCGALQGPGVSHRVTRFVLAGVARAVQAALWGWCQQTVAMHEVGRHCPGLLIRRSALFLFPPYPSVPGEAMASGASSVQHRRGVSAGVISDLRSSRCC